MYCRPASSVRGAFSVRLSQYFGLNVITGLTKRVTRQGTPDAHHSGNSPHTHPHIMTLHTMRNFVYGVGYLL